MTLQEYYNNAKKFVGKDKITKYAKVKDGIVFITEDNSFLGKRAIKNNYYLVRNDGSVEITNPILCGLNADDVKTITFKSNNR